MKKSILFSIVLVLTMEFLSAQSKEKASLPPAPGVRKAKLVLVARPVNNQILLRWAPDQPFAWKQAVQYGYVLERFTISRNDTLLKKPELIVSRQVIKPQPLKVWDSLIVKNDYAAAMAQALYGEDFEVSIKDDKGLTQIINQTEELKQRFIMSLYAADHDFMSARYAGLGWIDKTAKPNEKYLYRLYTRIPKDKVIIDTALAFIGLKEVVSLPKPSDVFAEFGDKSALLSWDFDSYAQHYHSYYIEKSTDGGKTFTRTSDLPLTKGTESQKAGNGMPGMLYFIDSLEKNNQEYLYRIAGVNLFGEVGPYSDIVKGKGIFQLQTVPGITGITFNEKKKPELNWEFEDSLNHFIQSFELKGADRIDGNYVSITKGIKPDQRKLQLDSVPSVAYVTVTAVTLEGPSKTSVPFLIQAEDSIPPAVPLHFTGVIDSAGVVTLNWEANKERDLFGYKLFRAQVSGHEYTLVTDSVIKTNSFKDTVALKSLNSKVFYTITAVDQRYNQSAFAPAIEIRKPDVVPPSQPVFSSYEIKETAVVVNWINSNDADVQRHVLYRTESGQLNGQWTKVAEITDKRTVQFSDQLKDGGKTVSYTLIAVDSAGLESAPSVPLTIQVPALRVRTAISKLDATADRDGRKIILSWQLTTPQISQLELYRGEDKLSMSLYKVLKGYDNSFIDEDLRVNTKYKYAIRAVYPDGKYSDFKQKTITY